jgi:hypothetical protein
VIDLKLSRKEKDEKMESMVPVAGDDIPEYPWGFELHFETDQIEKLNLGKFMVGNKVSIAGTGKVTQVNISKRDGQENRRRSMDIQIEKIAVRAPEDANKKMRDEIAGEVFED